MVFDVVDPEVAKVLRLALFGYPQDKARAIVDNLLSQFYPRDAASVLPKDECKVGRNAYYVGAETWRDWAEREPYQDHPAYYRNPESIREPRKGADQWHELDFYCFAVRGAGDEVLATLDVGYSYDKKLLTKDQVEAIGLFVDLAGISLEQTRGHGLQPRLQEKSVEKTMLLEDVLNIASSIVSERDAGKLSDMILSSLSSLFEFGKVSLVLFDESEGAFKWVALFGYPEDVAKETKRRVIPTEIIMEDIKENKRVGKSAYFTGCEELTSRQLAHYVEPARYDPSKPAGPRKENEWRQNDCLAFVLHDSTGRIVGVIYPSDPKESRMPDKDNIETIEVLISLAEIALENAKMSADREQALRLTSQRTEQLSRILDLASSIMYIRDLDQMLDDLLKTLARLMGIRRMVIGIKHADEGVYKIEAVYGYPTRAAEAIKSFHYPVAQVDSVLESGPFPALNPYIKWRRKVGRTTYYMPVEGQVVSVLKEEMPYYPEPELIRMPRSGKGRWHEMDWMDTLILDRTGLPIAYLEVLKPRDERIPDNDTIEVIEIFASLAGIAIENARMFQEHIDSRRDSELYTDVLSHDIKNFNQAILGYLDLLRMRIKETTASGLIDKIADQVMSISWLASNVRTMSRVTFGDVELTRTDLGGIIVQCEKSLSQYYPNRKIMFKHNFPQDPVFVQADDLVWEMFTNILTNAVKYDQHDPLEIDVTLERSAKDGKRLVTVSIADRGRGIPDDVKAVIFERFSKAPKRKGEGMGLHIVTTLAKRYNGSVWVEDRVKGDYTKGAVFKVKLPSLD